MQESITKNSFLLKCEDVSVIRNGNYILKDISFQIKKGELVAILGRNGMGKSTLCKVLSNNIRLSSGKIIKTSGLRLSYVPQIQELNVVVPITVKEFLFLGKSNKYFSEEDEQLQQQLDIVKLLKQSMHSLSGGERQKVILARALMLQPDLLILDEPASFIDFAHKGGVYYIINSLRKARNFGVIMVSHDVNLVLSDTSWVICLNHGKIGCQGNATSIKSELEFTKIFGDIWGYYQHKDVV